MAMLKYRGLSGRTAILMGVLLVVVLLFAASKGRERSRALDGLPAANPELPRITDLSPELEAELEALGYVAGTEPAPLRRGVTHFDAEGAYEGASLCVSAHGFVAFLIDMEGNILHRWQREFETVWEDPGVTGPLRFPPFWRRAHLFENGDLLVIYTDRGLAKLDKDSNLLWANQANFHHDLDVLPDGSFFTLARSMGKLNRNGQIRGVFEEFICEFDAGGTLIRKTSILRAFERSEFAHLLQGARNVADITHANTVQYFDGSLAHVSPLFKKGNVLTSCRTIDTVAIIDRDVERVVWAKTEPWVAQHDPTLLPNGRMLVFDNRGLGDRSRVFEFDPLDGRIVWSYGDQSDEFFLSSAAGACQRLPNGNTLVVQSNAGRAFEVTPDNTVVWDYTNPFSLRKNEKIIAALYDVVRLDSDFPLDWLN